MAWPTKSRASSGRSAGLAQTSSVHLCGSRISGVPRQMLVMKKISTRGSRERRNITPAGCSSREVELDAELLADLPDRAVGGGLPEVDMTGWQAEQPIGVPAASAPHEQHLAVGVGEDHVDRHRVAVVLGVQHVLGHCSPSGRATSRW